MSDTSDKGCPMWSEQGCAIAMTKQEPVVTYALSSSQPDTSGCDGSGCPESSGPGSDCASCHPDTSDKAVQEALDYTEEGISVIEQQFGLPCSRSRAALATLRARIERDDAVVAEAVSFAEWVGCCCDGEDGHTPGCAVTLAKKWAAALAAREAGK